jgi:cyclohexyl-isocyanide hydratase
MLEPGMTRRELAAAVAKSGLSVAALAALADPAAADAASTPFPAERQGSGMKAALLVYPQMTALDMVGPLQVLTGMGRIELNLVWKSKQPVVTDSGMPIVPTMTFDDCPKDLTVLFAPGGSAGTIAAMNDDAVLDFLADSGKSAKYVTSVCTGALLLGAAGLLKGYRATTHWLAHDTLSLFGATPVKSRVVEDRNRITGAGVSAGLDFGLRLVALLQNEQRAKSVQLMLEYDPQPPFRAGSPELAGKEISDPMRRSLEPALAMIRAAAKRSEKRRA